MSEDVLRPVSRSMPTIDPARQMRIGLGLAGAIMVAWFACHVAGVFLFRFGAATLPLAPILVAVQCWLNVGLFIVAHDAMHGSLAPFRPRLNRAVGRVSLLLYAGFWYDGLLPKHFAHHRHAGTGGDPDFDEDHPSSFWPWYRRFFLEYFGWTQLAILAAISAVYLLLFQVPLSNLLLFWALPAVLSSVQLFVFGTYLPHRRDDVPFADRHNARTMDFPPWLSLITCFHFGYHHAHHVQPTVPWWRLPSLR